MPTPNQLAVIHDGKRSVGLNESQYRTLLKNVGGVESSKGLDNAGVEDVLAVFEDMGFDSHPAGKTYWRDKVASRGHRCGERMVHLIRELAAQQRYELAGLVWNFSGCVTNDETQLTPSQGWQLIEMLKATVGREPRSNAGPAARTAAGTA